MPAPKLTHAVLWASVLLYVCSIRCVRLGKFDADRTITFIPPDGEFELMRYRYICSYIILHEEMIASSWHCSIFHPHACV
jgi:Adaptor complexes medium subunit family